MRTTYSNVSNTVTAFSASLIDPAARELGTRARLISSGVKLFQAKSYCDVSVSDILLATRLPKGSFYHHFPDGKEQLACAAVEVIGAEVNDLLNTSLTLGLSGDNALVSTANAIAAWLVKTDYQQGALLGCLMTGDPPPRLSAQLISTRTAWCVALARLWPEKTDCRDLALLVLATLEGGIAMARLHRDTRYLLDPVARLSVLMASA